MKQIEKVKRGQAKAARQANSTPENFATIDKKITPAETKQLLACLAKHFLFFSLRKNELFIFIIIFIAIIAIMIILFFYLAKAL